MFRFCASLFLSCCVVFGNYSPAYAEESELEGPVIPGATVNEQVLTLPGDPGRPAKLQATLLMPTQGGPFPLAIFNHGASHINKNSHGVRQRRSYYAFYFLSRGYAVLMPMMRGFAESGGQLVNYGCNVGQLGRDNALDIAATIKAVATKPGIDASHVVVVGQSFGGWNTLALGAQAPSSVVGLVNFNGGVRVSTCTNDDKDLLRSAEEFGKKTRIPSLWFYGDNDSLFPTPLWHSMFDRYKAAGAQAQLIAFGSFGGDSHIFANFPESVAIFSPPLDAFLERIHMPNRLVNPDYLPVPSPPPSGFAKLEDVSAVPYLNAAGRALYQKYLEKPFPKAFLISPGGFVSSQQGGFDPLGQGQAPCRQIQQVCQPYAVDDQVVWVPPPPRPAPSRFAALNDIAAVPYVKDSGRDLYRRFLNTVGPRAFVVSPDGQAYAYFSGVDAFAEAWVICKSRSQVCEPYAIDLQVVWQPPAAQKAPANKP